MRSLFATSPSVGGDIGNSIREAQMRRFTPSTFGVRLALMTTFVSVVAALVPLVALAGNGDPFGT